MTRLGPARMFRRQVMADKGAAITVAIVVLVVAALLAAWPRAIEQMFTDELHERITQSAPGARDVSGRATLFSPWGPGAEVPAADVHPHLTARLSEIRESAAPLTRSVLSEPAYQLVDATRQVIDHIPEEITFVELTLLADPAYADRIELVDGALPAGVTIDETSAPLETEDPVLAGADLRTRVIDIALSEPAAERLEWPVGQVRSLELDGQFPLPRQVRLTGTFEAVDPADGYWSHSVGVLKPFEVTDPDAGTTVMARAFIEPDALLSAFNFVFDLHAWYQLDGSQLVAADAPVLRDELSRLRSAATRIGLTEEVEQDNVAEPIRLGTATIDTLDELAAQQASATALLALVAAGPLGVALAVLALGAKLVVERRRRAMALITARGAAGRQLRILLAVEGALLGVPAAVVAVVLVARYIPGDGGFAGYVLPLLVGIAPAALLPWLARPSSMRAQRRDAGTRRRAWLRWTLDALVVGGAAASWVVLNRRGLASGDADAGVNPLLAVAPLLLALAVCVLVLRVYPLPVAALSRAMRGRKGVIGFVGSARAIRDPAAGLAPVLALVVGLSVAVFSTVLWSTTHAGAESTSYLDVGADLRATGPAIGDEQIEALESIPGVVAAVALGEEGGREVTVGHRTITADVYVADTVRLAQVQFAVDSGLVASDELRSRTPTGAIPAVVSADLAEPGEDGTIAMHTGVEITVAAVADRMAGIGSAGRAWILLDRAAIESGLGPDRLRPMRTALIRTDGAAVDPALILAELSPDTEVSAAADVFATVRAGAVGSGLTNSFATAAVVVGVLAAAAVVLTMVIGAPARGRLFSQLRTLGLSGRQAQGIAAWEMAPLALSAVVFGTALGLGIPWLVFSAIDLRPLTGAATQPAVTIDWSLVGVAAGSFVLIVVIAVAVATAASRRLRLGAVLRVGEEL